jgi:hypothetical protein
MDQPSDLESDEPTKDERPWEQPGAMRRDCEPHRGRLLENLAIVSVVCSAFSLLVFPVAISVPLSAAVVLIARLDLKKMSAGTMDRKGANTVRSARLISLISLLVTLLYALLFAGLFYWDRSLRRF